MPQNNASAVNEAEKIDESEAVKGRVTRVQGSVIDIEFPIGICLIYTMRLLLRSRQ